MSPPRPVSSTSTPRAASASAVARMCERPPSPRTPSVHERALQRQRIGVRDKAKAPHLDGPKRFTHRTRLLCLTHLTYLSYLPLPVPRSPERLALHARHTPLGSQFSSA